MMANIRSALDRCFGFVDKWLILPAPIILAAVSSYFLFIVIIPFHMLRIDKVEQLRVVSGQVSLHDALGNPAAVLAFVLEILMWTMTWAWALSVLNAVRTRKWYVIVILALAPLPLAYYNAGPYASEMKWWVAPL